MLISAVIFLVICVVVPIYIVRSTSQKKPEQLQGASKESSPIAYIVVGTLLAIPAGTAWIIVCSGYLLPGLEMMKPNFLSEITIHKPNKGGPRIALRLQETETSFLLTLFSLFFLLFALFLIFRGIRRLWTQSTAPSGRISL